MSDNDDELRGRVLSRREVLALFGSAGAMLLVACSGDEPASAQPSATSQGPAATGSAATIPPATTTPSGAAAVSTAVPSCVVRPELTEGPYFVDEMLNRSDIRTDPSNGSVREGAQLNLVVNVSRLAGTSCSSLSNAMVDVWHCDAAGVYSDASDRGFNTRGQKFLRGFQNTDANGRAEFVTVYPGWYQGRAVHIHFKIRSGNTEFTSQWFFDETLTDQVHAQAPYAAKGYRTVKNEGDSIYRQAGSQLVLNVTRSANTYTATFDIALQA